MAFFGILESTDDITDAISGMTEAEMEVPDDDFRTPPDEDHDNDDSLPNQ